VKGPLERRLTVHDVEIRSVGDKHLVEGYAALFNVRSPDLGGFIEQVDRKAFNKTLKESDVRAVINHDENRLLGRSSAGTLKVSTDSKGLPYEVLLPDTTYARDLRVLMERQDIRESSFAFRAIDDDWEEDGDVILRTLKEVQLVDVSPVTYPAYLTTTSGLRSNALYGLAHRSGRNVTDLSDVDAIKRAINGEGSAGPEESTPRDTTIWKRRIDALDRLERALKES